MVQLCVGTHYYVSLKLHVYRLIPLFGLVKGIFILIFIIGYGSFCHIHIFVKIILWYWIIFYMNIAPANQASLFVIMADNVSRHQSEYLCSNIEQ